jgi:hypothetical protein
MKTNVFPQVSRIIIAGLILVANTSFAQFNSNANGAWTTGATWVGGVAPANNSGATVTVNHNITVPTSLQGLSSITVNASQSLTSGSAGTPQNLSLQSITTATINGSLIVFGNLTVNATALTVSGTLTVTGTITVTGGSTLTTTGTVTSAAISTSGAGGTVNVNSGGSLSVSGGVSLSSGGVVNIASGGSGAAGSFTSSNNATATLTNNGSFTINGTAAVGGLVTNNNTGTLQVNGNYTTSGSNSSITTTSGAMNVTGAMSLTGSSKMQVNPHVNSMVIVDGTVTVSGNENLTVGTGVAPAPYASMAIRGNLSQTTSGDVRVRTNGRLAVFGNVTDSGGGDSRLNIESGGQMYVHGSINYSGGGSSINNANATSPYGLYVNGTTTNSGGGAVTTTNTTDQATMQSTNMPFYTWVASIPNGPLPVTLITFEVKEYTQSGVVLGWATATEKDFHYFSVEKSVNGKEYYEIGTVEGSGNSKTRRDYTFEDGNLIGRVYYRLKAVDLNGAYEYLKVITATATAKNTIDVYPNPSAGKSVNIQVNFEQSSDALIEIYDNMGTKIMDATISGLSNEVVFGSTLKPGTYLIKYISSEHAQNLRFVVR